MNTTLAPRKGTGKARKVLAPSSLNKSYVLDTNVLLHDPDSVFHFQDNFVFLPVEILEELDKFKTEQTERGANARKMHRILDDLFKSDPRTMQEGVNLPNGGKLFIALASLDPRSPRYAALTKVFPDLGKMDNRILASALHIQETMPPPTVIVSKDVNLRMKALAMGLRAEDYLTDKKQVVDETDIAVISTPEDAFNAFYHEGRAELGERGAQLAINEYCILSNEMNPSQRVPARHYGNGQVRKLRFPPQLQLRHGAVIRPRSFEQQFVLDAVMDPSLPLVTIRGKAGTGKTLLSVAASLSQVLNSSDYDGVTISRPVVVMGKDLGALPGGLQEKLSPYLQPYYDALNYLMPARPVNLSMQAYQERNPQQFQEVDRNSRKGKFRHQQGQPAPQSANPNNSRPIIPPKPYETLVAAGVLEIEALQYIRGRSIPRRIFLVDESQNLTAHEIKTIITRMSEGSKLILIGDPGQIDTPFVDGRSNGLVYTQSRFRNHKLAAHIKLTKGERSPLADAAAELL